VARPEKSLNDALFNNQGLREGGTRGISHPVGWKYARCFSASKPKIASVRQLPV